MIKGQVVTNQALLQNLIQNNTFAILINDVNGILSAISTIENVVNLEVDGSGNGYSRQQVPFAEPIGVGGKSVMDGSFFFQANGDNIRATHFGILIGGNLIQNDVTGTIYLIKALNNGNSLLIPDGESYPINITLQSNNYFIG